MKSYYYLGCDCQGNLAKGYILEGYENQVK